MTGPSAPSTVAIKTGSEHVRVRPSWFTRGMLAPLLIVLGLVVGFPLVYAGYLSFTDYRLTERGTPDLVWFDSYLGAFSDPSFWRAFRTTVSYLVIAVAGELVLGLFIAMALQKQKWAKDFTRALLLAPMFITPIAVGLTFRFLLNNQLGAIPELLSWIGVTYDFLGSGKALITLALIDVWQWTPFMVLLLLAGLESLPKAPLEAARVDGASWWYTFRRVMLPLLSPVLVIAVLLRALDAMKVFEYVYATTRGGPGEETQTLQYYTYQTGIQFFRLGSASAMAFIVLAVVLTVIVVIYRRMERTREQ